MRFYEHFIFEKKKMANLLLFKVYSCILDSKKKQTIKIITTVHLYLEYSNFVVFVSTLG